MQRDTTPAAFEAQLAALRRLGPVGRMLLAAEMSEDVRRAAIESERARHPELSEEEARLAIRRRTWGAELADRVEGARRR